jgi:hypothetical protein
MVVHPAAGGGHLIVVDGNGRTIADRALPPPEGLRGPFVEAAAINADVVDRAWALLTWEGDDAYVSQLVPIAVDGTAGAVLRLPKSAPPSMSGNDSDERVPRFLRRLPDGSLIAGGAASLGPPSWWFARFTTGGRLLHEAKSRRYPDYVDDAWANADGGFTLLMVDAEHGSETVTLRRYGRDGKLAQRHQFPALRQSIGCAALVGETRQMRLHTYESTSRTVLVVHDADRGIVRQIDLGGGVCHALQRSGTRVVLASQADGDRKPFTLRGLSLAGDTRWSIDIAAQDVRIAASQDDGVIVLRLDIADGKPRMMLARYRLPRT